MFKILNQTLDNLFQSLTILTKNEYLLISPPRTPELVCLLLLLSS